MLRTLYNEEHELFRENYRKFLIQEVAPHREAWRDAGIVPREMFKKMGEQGFLLTWADEQHGGLGRPISSTLATKSNKLAGCRAV